MPPSEPRKYAEQMPVWQSSHRTEMLGIFQTKERESVRAKDYLTPYLDPRAFQTVFPGTLPRWSPEMGQREGDLTPSSTRKKSLHFVCFISSASARESAWERSVGCC